MSVVMQRLKKGAAMRRLRLCGLMLSIVFIASCGGDKPNESGVYDHILSKNGITFAPPNLTIKGSKEKAMGFEIWMNYSSNSFRCLGSSMMDSRDNWWFYPGGTGGAQKAGTAKRMYEVRAGKQDYAISIPLKMQDARECVWYLREVQLQVLDPFIGERSGDLASFVLRDEADMAPMEAQYDIYCQKQQARVPQYDCRHKSQNGKNVVVHSKSVLSGIATTINVKASPDILPIRYK